MVIHNWTYQQISSLLTRWKRNGDNWLKKLVNMQFGRTSRVRTLAYPCVTRKIVSFVFLWRASTVKDTVDLGSLFAHEFQIRFVLYNSIFKWWQFLHYYNLTTSLRSHLTFTLFCETTFSTELSSFIKSHNGSKISISCESVQIPVRVGNGCKYHYS